MSTFKCLAVLVVSLGLLFCGSRPVSAQGNHVEGSSLVRRMFQIVRESRHVQPRAQALYKCQVSSLPVGVSASVIVLQHNPVVNLSCGWNDKHNTAFQYQSSGSNYRMYRPSVSQYINGGSLISFKMDHIRGMATDDYAVVRIQLDRLGRIIAEQCDINIRGRGSFSTGLITNVVPSFRSYTPVFATVLRNGANHLFDSSGRSLFPTEIEHRTIDVVNAIVLCPGCRH
jgi:hypothetical protein